MAWVESLTAGRHWDQERDTPRIRKAFATMATGSRWPTPHDFFASLPSATKQKALPARVSDPEASQRQIEAIRKLLKGVGA